MVLIFDKQITIETVEELIKKAEEKEDTLITIYMSSEGGYVYASRILTDYLISKARTCEVAVIAAGYVDSCALECLIDLSKSMFVRVAVLEGTTSVVHAYSASTDSRELLKTHAPTASKLKSLERVNNSLAQKLKLGHDQAAKFFAGEDVLLDTPDIIKILS